MAKSDLLRIFQTGSICESRITDWKALITDARDHQLTEPVARLAKQAPEGTIPPEVLQYFDQVYRQTLAQNLLVVAESEQLLQSLNEAGVRCIILKGVSLGEKYYGDIGARKSGDIDFLVEEENLYQSIEVFKRHGYTYNNAYDLLLKNDKRPPEHHFVFKKTTPFISWCIEIHFHITYRHNKKIDMAEIWSRSTRTKFGKTLVNELSPLDLLLYLCMHSARHGFSTLRQVLDVARCIEVEGDSIDWNHFVLTVRKYGMVNRVYASLYYAQRILAAPVPEEVLDSLGASSFFKRLLQQECRADQLPRQLGLLAFGIARNENMLGLTLDLWRSLFPPAAMMRIIYGLEPSESVWRYYPLRWREYFGHIYQSLVRGS